MRKPYIDNLRNYTILLLFPVHTFMIWNDFGFKFYIWQGENKLLSTLIVLVNPWFMPLLFVLAGISARYALETRTAQEFLRQRSQKLLLPFLSGLLLYVPFQSLYARKHFYNYNGTLGSHWKYFFTHVTDLSGYDGAFTPGHLWFILFLFLISAVTLPLFCRLPAHKAAPSAAKMPFAAILSLFIPLWLFYYLGNFGGFSLGKNLALYLAGYYILSNDAIMHKLEQNRKWLACFSFTGTAALVVLYYQFSYYGDLWINAVGWVNILFLLICAKKYCNQQTACTNYFNKASYSIYLLHQSILVALAYYIVRTFTSTPMQILFIGGGSFVLTLLAYHIIRQLPFVRKLIGLQ